MGFVVLEEVSEVRRRKLGVVRQKGVEGQFEEAVKGGSAGIDGGNTGGSQHHMLFLYLAAYIAQEGAFSGSSLSGKKEGVVGMANERERILEFGRGGVNLFLHKQERK